MCDNRLFIAEVKKQLTVRGWKYAELSDATGYSLGTLYLFMSGKRDNPSLRQAIAKALDIND